MRRLLTTLLLIVVIYPIWAANISHPSLLFTPQRIEEAKKMMKADPARETAWKSILKQADDLLEKNDVRKMEYLALAYQMTGEQRYGDKLRTLLLDIA